MLKPESLRNALYKSVPMLRDNPDMIHLFADNGKIAATLARSLSFEKQYTLNVVVTDFTGELDLLFVPIMAWLRVNQPDIMTSDEGMKKGFTFNIDLNSNSSIDISINLLLTERTVVRQEGDALHVETLPEPTEDDTIIIPAELWRTGELVSRWHE